MKKLYKRIKARVIALGAFGGVLGGVGALGAFGVCHSICVAAIGLLALFGITVIGMPFAFLQEPVFYIPFFVVGLASIAGSIYLYIKHRRMSCKR